MARILIYILPVLVNYILGGMFFITAYRFSEAGAGGMVVTGTMAAWALVYCLVSLVMGRITTSRNAPYLIVAAGLGIFVSSLGFILFPDLNLQFLWIVLIGIASAVYCAPFQVFMKSIEPDQSAGTVRSTALYTFAWSSGLATGPFIFGLLAWKTGFLINALLGLLIAGGIWGIYWNYRKHPPVPAAVDQVRKAPELDYSSRPDLAWVGWLVGGIGTVTVALVRTLVPYKSAQLEIPKADIGFVLAMVSYVQALMALSLIRSRTWMYKPLPALLIGASGTIGLLLFCFGTHIGMFYLAALFYGLYSGCFYFYLVFHSLVHPTRSSRYVAVNEVVVGVTSIVGPLAGGYVVKLSNASVPFLLCGILACVAAGFQAWTFFRSNVKNSVQMDLTNR